MVRDLQMWDRSVGNDPRMGEHRITWTGLVHPQGGNWRLDFPVRVKYREREVGVMLNRSVFHMIVTEDREDDEPFDAWAHRVWLTYVPAVQGVVDALGFHLGAHLTLEPIGGAIDGAGGVGMRVDLHGFSYGADENGNIAGDVFGPTATSAVGDSAARFALRDVARALAFDEDCAFHCFRALEDIRQHYLPAGASDDGAARKASWDTLHADLGTERDAFTDIQKEALRRRHGDEATSTPEQRAEWTRLTRDVIYAYLTKNAVTGLIRDAR